MDSFLYRVVGKKGKQAAAMGDRRKRASKGVIIFSSILILVGSVNFVLIIASLFLLNFQYDVPGMFAFMPHSTMSSSLFWLSTIVSMFVMLCWLIAGIGMLSLKEWARQALLTSMGIYFLNMFVNIIINIFMAYEYYDQLPVRELIIGIACVFSLSVSMVYFFTHQNIIEQFKKHTRPVRR